MNVPSQQIDTVFYLKEPSYVPVQHWTSLVSPPGMVETPRLRGEEKVVVTWSRAAVPMWSAHEDGP